MPFLIGLLPYTCLCGYDQKHRNDAGISPAATGPGASGQRVSLLWPLLAGYMISWAAFQLLAVPMILKQQKFHVVATSYLVVSLILALAGIIVYALGIKNGWVSLKTGLSQIKADLIGTSAKQDNGTGNHPGTGKPAGTKTGVRLMMILFWLVFAGLLLFQLYMSYHLAYSDGDDAFYLPVSVTALEADSMYLNNPYTGNTQIIDVRHGLGPYPIWLAYLAKFTGVNATVMAQSMLPVVLIVLTYVVYLEIGRGLLAGSMFKDARAKNEDKPETHKEGNIHAENEGWMLPLFMIFVSALQIFGNYSFYTGATFLLTRSRQGKEALGNLILPMIFLLLLEMSKQIQGNAVAKESPEDMENGKAAGKDKGLWIYYLLLTCTGIAACLCSTMGSFLFVMPVALAALLFAILYKKPLLLVSYALTCIPAGCFALLYLFLR